MMIDLFSSNILPNTVPEEEGERAGLMQNSGISPLKSQREYPEANRRNTNSSIASSPIKVRMQNTEEDVVDSFKIHEIIDVKKS